MKPQLTKNIDVEVFLNYYWLKEELQVFCRENGLSPSGSKVEISERIEIFLRSGEIRNPIKKNKSIHKKGKGTPLSLDTLIVEGHRCSQEVRAFFKKEIPNFHFSTYIQNYFKENVGKKYRDAIRAWHQEEERKKDPSYKKEIAPQFEYNQFISDFFADPENKGKSREEAIKQWNIIKSEPGSNRYKKKP